MDRKCTACNIKRDKDIHKKNRIVCKYFYKEKKKISINPEKQNKDKTGLSAHKNHRHTLMGPNNSCRFYCILKLLEEIGD